MAEVSHAVFHGLGAQRLTSENFDSQLAEASPDRLVCIFFWGHQCPNCEVAKRALLLDIQKLQALPMIWFDVNTYEDFDLGTRFGLHGIPTFLFFHGGKKLGRISPFPGIDVFIETLHQLIEKHLPQLPQ